MVSTAPEKSRRQARRLGPLTPAHCRLPFQEAIQVIDPQIPREGKQATAAIAVGIAAAATVAILVTTGSASSGSASTSAAQGSAASPATPEDPFIGYCPTPDDVEAHAERYGLDYKPTVACTRQGMVDRPAGWVAPVGDDQLGNAAAWEYHQALIESATPLPDSDGDPASIEGQLPGGRTITVFEMAANPSDYEGMDIDDLAQADK